MAKKKPVSILARCKPRGDRVVVRRDIIRRNPDGSITSGGGILLPDTMMPDHRETGTVTAVGPGAMRPTGKRIPMDLKVGDRVLITGYASLVLSGDITESNGFDDEYVILREEEILAVLEPPEE